MLTTSGVVATVTLTGRPETKLVGSMTIDTMRESVSAAETCPATNAAILAGIRDAGMSLRTACAYAGISDDTLVRRRKADPKLAERVEHAREMFKAKMVTLISAAAPKNWNAAAWMLERKYPEEFGRQRLEITGVDGGKPLETSANVKIDFEQLSDDELRRLAEGGTH